MLGPTASITVAAVLSAIAVCSNAKMLGQDANSVIARSQESCKSCLLVLYFSSYEGT